MSDRISSVLSSRQPQHRGTIRPGRAERPPQAPSDNTEAIHQGAHRVNPGPSISPVILLALMYLGQALGDLVPLNTTTTLAPSKSPPADPDGSGTGGIPNGQAGASGDDGGSDGGLSGGAIAGIVIALAVVLIFAVGGAVYYRRSQRTEQARLPANHQGAGAARGAGYRHEVIEMNRRGAAPGPNGDEPRYMDPAPVRETPIDPARRIASSMWVGDETEGFA